ncbi:MAG: hypothetical protein GY895_18040 [Phycisphaera sp.]|nr:hypothetical protein [Phycisphaera sp.]
MHRVERFLVHALLLVLLVAVFSDRPFVGTTADAEPSRLEETIGPADRLVLLRDGKEIDVTAAANGISWGDAPTARAWSLGAVDVSRLLGSLVESERFAADRVSFQEEAESQQREFEERFEAFREEFGELKPEDPDFARAQASWESLRQEFSQWQQGTMAIQQKLASEQIEAAYRELVEAVDIVAERSGIEIVLRFVPVDDPFEADNIELTSEQVQRRLMIRYPDAIDLTSKVESELGL